jgi:hypothetical protein
LLRVRNLLYGAAALALASLTSPETTRSAIAASASALFEAIPFLAAGVVLSRVLPGRSSIVDLLGCGCGAGPSARSLPAAAATWMLFGPVVATARFIAALIVARALQRGSLACAGRGSHLLGDLAALVPAAILAGVTTQIFARVDLAGLSPTSSATLGAVLGFIAPCGLGAVTVAAALRTAAPLATATFLCIAGIVDFRTFRRSAYVAPSHDPLGYALLAAGLTVVAARHGDALVRPAFTAALAPCAAAAVWCTLRYRNRRCGSARLAPAIMLVGALVGAPPPQYYATETTMRDLFAGERLSFTGALVHRAGATAVVRYAIACCRADAAPIAVRLDRAVPYSSGTWLRVDGTIERGNGDLRLAPRRVERVAAPSDPFLYL